MQHDHSSDWTSNSIQSVVFKRLSLIAPGEEVLLDCFNDRHGKPVRAQTVLQYVSDYKARTHLKFTTRIDRDSVDCFPLRIKRIT